MWDITANSRYRLWVNGEPILSVPCKEDRYRHYYEIIDLSEKLKVGKNVFAVQVLLCDQNAINHQYDARAPLFSVASLSGIHKFAMEGQIFGKNGELLGEVTTGKVNWKEIDFDMTTWADPEKGSGLCVAGFDKKTV